MAWIPPVVTLTTIKSAEYGNAVRERIVHYFATKAERDASPAGAVNGLRCYVEDVGITYIRRGGAWWVESMPWRAYTVAAWVGSPGLTGLSIIATQQAVWRQSMGAAQALARFDANTNTIFNVNATVFANLPTPATVTGPLGQAKVYPNYNQLNYGGWANYYTSTQLIVCNVGNAVPPNVIINVPSGNQNVAFDLNLHYQCDPTVDTP